MHHSKQILVTCKTELNEDNVIIIQKGGTKKSPQNRTRPHYT